MVHVRIAENSGNMGPYGDVAPTYSKKPFFLNPET